MLAVGSELAVEAGLARLAVGSEFTVTVAAAEVFSPPTPIAVIV